MNSIIISALTISVILGVMCMLIWLCHKLLCKKTSARIRVFMWWVIALWLCVPLKINLPKPPVNIEIPRQSIQQTITSADITTVFVNSNAAPAPIVYSAKPQPVISLKQIVLTFWAAGAVLCLLARLMTYFIWRHIILKKAEGVTDTAMLNCNEGAKQSLNYNTKLPLLESRFVHCPMVIGLLKPKLIIPKGLFDGSETQLMLIHEYTHLKRKDIFCKSLWVIATSLHWFNPAVWLGCKCALKDLELACDETVLLNQPIDRIESYSKALLWCADFKKSSYYDVLFATSFGEGKINMKSRLDAIFNQKHKRQGIIVFAAAMAVIASVSVLVGCTVSDKEKSQSEITPSSKTIKIATMPYNSSIKTSEFRCVAIAKNLIEQVNLQQKLLGQHKWTVDKTKTIEFNGVKYYLCTDFDTAADYEAWVNQISKYDTPYEVDNVNSAALNAEILNVDNKLYVTSTRTETEGFYILDSDNLKVLSIEQEKFVVETTQKINNVISTLQNTISVQNGYWVLDNFGGALSGKLPFATAEDFTTEKLIELFPSFTQDELLILSDYALSFLSGKASDRLLPDDRFFNNEPFKIMPVCEDITIDKIYIFSKPYAVIDMFVKESGTANFPLGRNRFVLDVQDKTNDIKQIVPQDIFTVNQNAMMTFGQPIMDFRTLAGITETFSSASELKSNPLLLNSILYNLNKYEDIEVFSKGATLQQVSDGAKKYFGLDNYAPPPLPEDFTVQLNDSGSYVLMPTSPDVGASQGFRVTAISGEPTDFTITLAQSTDNFGISYAQPLTYSFTSNTDGSIKINSCKAG